MSVSSMSRRSHPGSGVKDGKNRTAQSSERLRKKRLQLLESEMEVVALRYCRGRQMSEPFPDGLTIFQRSRLERINAGRRLSEMLHDYDVNIFVFYILTL